MDKTNLLAYIASFHEMTTVVEKIVAAGGRCYAAQALRNVANGYTPITRRIESNLELAFPELTAKFRGGDTE